MPTTPSPVDSLQAKLTALVESLDPAELDLFAVIVQRARGDDVEGFSLTSPPSPIPIPYPISPVSANSVTQVLNGIGSALNASARKGL